MSRSLAGIRAEQHEASHPQPLWQREEEVCGNCGHWDWATARRMGLSAGLNLAPCAAGAVEIDAGEGAVVLLPPRGHCRDHGEAFTPEADFLAELARDAA